jgi:hypothetical protein
MKKFSHHDIFFKNYFSSSTRGVIEIADYSFFTIEQILIKYPVSQSRGFDPCTLYALILCEIHISPEVSFQPLYFCNEVLCTTCACISGT